MIPEKISAGIVIIVIKNKIISIYSDVIINKKSHPGIAQGVKCYFFLYILNVSILSFFLLTKLVILFLCGSCLLFLDLVVYIAIMMYQFAYLQFCSMARMNDPILKLDAKNTASNKKDEILSINQEQQASDTPLQKLLDPLQPQD